MITNKKILAALVLVLVLVAALGWFEYLKKAHSTFENYYNFRGCTQLLTKTDNDATCRLKNGEFIKIVKYQGLWYLDGDLPGKW